MVASILLSCKPSCTNRAIRKDILKCLWKQECNCFRVGCPDAELMTSLLHLDARIEGLIFDITLQDSLAELCETLSRIFQEQCE